MLALYKVLVGILTVPNPTSTTSPPLAIKWCLKKLTITKVLSIEKQVVCAEKSLYFYYITV